MAGNNSIEFYQKENSQLKKEIKELKQSIGGYKSQNTKLKREIRRFEELRFKNIRGNYDKFKQAF